MGIGRRQVITVDHEHPVSAELCTVGPHLPVVLHDNLITDIQFEDDHRPRRGCRGRRRRSLLLDACPVAQHGKEEFAEIHAPILSRDSGDDHMPADSLKSIHGPEAFLQFGRRTHRGGWLRLTTLRETECRCWLLGPQHNRLPCVMSARGRVIVITGAMAAGKSSVADLLAIRLPKSVHIHGDMFRRMVVNGRADMTPNPSPDAIAQLNLRYDLAAQAADRFAEEGFDAIVQDVILGKDLADFVKRIASHERYLVVLSPSLSALEWQEEQRTKAGYVHLSAGALDEVLRRETSHIGYWLDCSSQTTDETVADILANLDKAAV